MVQCAHLEKWWSSSMGWIIYPIYDMENKQFMVWNHQPEYLHSLNMTSCLCFHVPRRSHRCNTTAFPLGKSPLHSRSKLLQVQFQPFQVGHQALPQPNDARSDFHSASPAAAIWKNISKIKEWTFSGVWLNFNPNPLWGCGWAQYIPCLSVNYPF